jgi:hypothetical protein
VAAYVAVQNQAAFGYDPRNAGHNFAFNFTYFFPAILLSAILSLVAIICYLLAIVHFRKARTRLRFGEWMAILPAVPIFALAVTFAIGLGILLSQG